MSVDIVYVYSDGGARNNPGPAAAAFCVYNHQNNLLEERSWYLGKKTNNQAEYEALLGGLIAGMKYAGMKIVCFLDSELVVKQLNGQYKVKDTQLRNMYNEIMTQRCSEVEIEFKHIPREKNKNADRLVNEILNTFK